MPKKTLQLFKNYIPLEDAIQGKQYKFTLNYVLKEYDDKFTKLIYYKFKVCQLLKTLKNANFTFCIELSPTGRPHIHGYIVIMNVLDFFQDDLPKIGEINGLLGEEDNKTIKQSTWAEYCFKQQKVIGIGWVTIENVMFTALGYKKDKPKPETKMGLQEYKKDDIPVTPPNSPVSVSEVSERTDEEGYDMDDPDDSSDIDNDEITE